MRPSRGTSFPRLGARHLLITLLTLIVTAQLVGSLWTLSSNPCTIAYRIRDRMPEDNRVRWTWHQLRHTCASRYVERGGNLVALQRMLGHTTSRMTERYASLSDAALFADLERIENAQAAVRAAGVRQNLKTAHAGHGPQGAVTGPDTGPISGSATATTQGVDG